MATLELDPLFVKALRLLHSKAKDSTEQLKQMLDDVLNHSGSSLLDKDIDIGHRNLGSISLVKKSSPKHAADVPHGRKPSVKDVEEYTVKRKEQGEKRSFEKLRQDPDEITLKRVKIESPKVSRSPSPAVIKDDLKKDFEDEAGFDDDTDASHIAVEMGLACVVCRLLDVTSGNTLVECQDCHCLYHQECHKPPISDQDVNDPRVVWYCAKCMKNIKKIANKTTKTGKTPVAPKEIVAPQKLVKPEPAPIPATSVFKRVEPRTNSSTSGATTPPIGGANKPIGLAALAASLGGKAHPGNKTTQSNAGKTGSSSSSASSTSTTTTSSSAAASTSSSSSQSLAIKSSNVSSSSSGIKSVSSSGDCGKLGTILNLFSASRSSGNPPGNNGNGNGNGNGSSQQGSSGNGNSKSSSAGSSSSGNGNNGNNNNNNNNSSSSHSSSKSASSSSLMSADKRLQIMKKKAAAKRQEKRKLSTK